MMGAGRYDLIVEQGATLQRTFTWQDADGNAVDITGYEARLQVRPDHDSTTTLLDLDNDTKGGLNIPNGTDGKIELSVDATTTEGLDYRDAVWDLEMESPGGTVTRLLQGRSYVSKEVTR